MLQKLIPLMKVVAALDGAICSVAGVVGSAYPPAGHICLTVVIAGGTLGSVLAGVAKMLGVDPATGGPVAAAPVKP